MSDDILTRMGDGERLRMSAAEIREDIASGTGDAARRGKVSELTEDEQDLLLEIIKKLQ